MSKELSSLCGLLVEQFHGRGIALIYRALLIHGRCSISALRLRTLLSATELKRRLVVLVQHGLVYWWSEQAERSTGSTVYEASIPGAYALLRSGRFVDITNAQMGDHAGSVLLHLLTLGDAQPRDLLPLVSSKETKPLDKGMNLSKLTENNKAGVDVFKSVSASLETLQNTIEKLLQADFIHVVNESHYRTDEDNRAEAETVVDQPEAYKSQSKREQEALWTLAVQKRLKEWKEGVPPSQRSCILSAPSSCLSKRSNEGRDEGREDEDVLHPSKRRKVGPTHVPGVKTNGIVSEQGMVAESIGENTPFCAQGVVKVNDSSYLAYAETFTDLEKDETVIRVRHEKFVTLMRRQRFVMAVEQKISQSTAQIYQKLLCLLEPELQKHGDGGGTDLAFDDDEGQSGAEDEVNVSLERIAAEIPESDVLDDGFAKGFGRARDKHITGMNDEGSLETASSSQSQTGRSNGFDRDGDSDSSYDSNGSLDEGGAEHNGTTSDRLRQHLPPAPVLTPHQERVRRHLIFLARHPTRFVTRIARTTMQPERWSVRVHSVTRRIAYDSIIHIAAVRFGTLAIRLINILAERGKIDEKTLCSMCLVREKEMRSHLSQMHKAGMLELQEVPRDNARIPSRTSFLFYFDQDRCSRKLIDECYKVMTRCLQRLDTERAKVAATLEKAGRSDVVGNEDELLSAAEREALRNWRRTEDLLLTQVGRVDELVALLRDH